MDTNQLICPQLLSNKILEQILHERCIEIPEGIQSFDKDKLINVYNSIVLPFSQRKYNNERLLQKRLNYLRLSKRITTDNNDKSEHLRNTDQNLEEYDRKKESLHNHLESSKVNPAIDSSNDSQLSNQRICLSYSSQKTIEVNEQKRKSTIPLKIDSKKRQKITWP